uniref:Uncharacterized protein n=1 Tax=viral metagenome TaxID=1070528 RepID=A0A6H2A0M3_9ZZZZ
MKNNITITKDINNKWITCLKKAYKNLRREERLEFLFTHKILSKIPKSRRKEVAKKIIPHLQSIRNAIIKGEKRATKK